MAEDKGSTTAPHFAAVIDLHRAPAKAPAPARKTSARRAVNVSRMNRDAADELIEDCLYLLSLLEALGYLEGDARALDARGVSTLASTIVAKLRQAQKHLAAL